MFFKIKDTPGSYIWIERNGYEIWRDIPRAREYWGKPDILLPHGQAAWLTDDARGILRRRGLTVDPCTTR